MTAVLCYLTVNLGLLDRQFRVDNGLLHRTNERRLSNLRVGMDSGPSDRSTLPPQTAQALAPASQLVHLYWKYTRFTC